MKTLKHLLIELNACKEGVKWAEDKTIEEVIQECNRGDWLLWLAQKVDIDLKPLMLAKGHCANTVRHLMKDEKSIKAVDAAIEYGEGKATQENLYAAAHIAAYAADAAYAATYAARKENEILTADICRKYIGDLIINKVNELIK
jgi:hypothetical protein